MSSSTTDLKPSNSTATGGQPADPFKSLTLKSNHSHRPSLSSGALALGESEEGSKPTVNPLQPLYNLASSVLELLRKTDPTFAKQLIDELRQHKIVLKLNDQMNFHGLPVDGMTSHHPNNGVRTVISVKSTLLNALNRGASPEDIAKAITVLTHEFAHAQQSREGKWDIGSDEGQRYIKREVGAYKISNPILKQLADTLSQDRRDYWKKIGAALTREWLEEQKKLTLLSE